MLRPRAPTWRDGSADADPSSHRAVSVYLGCVTTELAQSQSRLAVVHAVVYAAGLVLLVAGIFGQVPVLLLLAGPCLAVSGALIWVGTHISLTGPVGGMLRKLLGPSRVVSMHLRAVFWILAGVLVTAWGLVGLRAGPQLAPQDPVIGHYAPSAKLCPGVLAASVDAAPLARQNPPSAPSHRSA